MRCAAFRVLVRLAASLAMVASAVPCTAGLFYNRQTFELGSQSTTTIDFEGLAGPPANYTAYPAGLSLAGVQFQGGISGPPPQQSLYVIDPLYHPDYDRGSGDVLSPGVPDGQLIFDLPAGTKAVGFDVVTFGSPNENGVDVVASSGGGDPVLQFGRAEGPVSGRAFVGFTSDTAIARIMITPSAAAITWIDNVRFGQPSSALVRGDANGDGRIDEADYNHWAEHYLQISRSFDQGDFNGDGIVDGADYTHWADQYSPQVSFAAAATPEPSTRALAAVALGLMLLRSVRCRTGRASLISAPARR